MEPARSRWRDTVRNLWAPNGSSSSRYRFLNDTNMLEALGSSRRRRKGRIEPWYRLTAPPEPPASASFAARDHARRGRLASAILLGFLLIGLALLPFVLRDPPVLLIVGGALAIIIGLAALNHSGRVKTVGVLMLLASYAILGVAALPNERLNANSLLTLDLLVITELIAATILPPVSALVVAAINSAMIAGVIFLAPAAASFTALVAASPGGVVPIVVRSVALQILVAAVAYLWVRGALLALRRADRAEEIAILERREIERTHEIEEGVRQLQSSLVQLANGDFSARVPPMRNALLWQVGVSVNNLIGRLGRFSQAGAEPIHLRDEARQLSEALYAWSRGEQPLWPTPGGSPLDEVTLALRRVLPMLAPVGVGASLPPLPPLPPLEPGMPNLAGIGSARAAPSAPPTPSHPAPRVTPGPAGVVTPPAAPVTPAPSALSGPLGPFPYFGRQGQPAVSSESAGRPATPSTPQTPPGGAPSYPDLYPTQRAMQAEPLAGIPAPTYPELEYPALSEVESPTGAATYGLSGAQPVIGSQPLAPRTPEQGTIRPALPGWLTDDPPSGAVRNPTSGEGSSR